MSDLRQYSSDELLRDGSSIHVRAIRSDDKQRLREHSEGLSARSVYFRFLGPKKRLTDKDLAAFTDLDFVNRVALVATVGKGGEEKIIGVGRYALSDTDGTASRSAELAFSVVDEYQNHGVGTLLLEHLLRIAREQGIRQFEAEVLADNKAMLGVIQGSGLIARRALSSGVVHVVFSTEETDAFAKAKDERRRTIRTLRTKSTPA
jgi:RimJ/RimL family protein N-acetyltransferase